MKKDKKKKTKGISFLNVDCTVQSIVKGLKKKRKGKEKQMHTPWVNFFSFIKNIKKG
jgi:hypothetical protein